MSQVVSWWKYNPILQKPTSLEPVKPWSWYWYYGPDPASGCSYGQYQDKDYEFDMITAKKSVVYSPASGKPMDLIEEIPFEEIKDQFSKVTSNTGTFRATCASCRAELLSDYPLGDLEKFYCCACGNVITAPKTIQQSMEKKTMTEKSKVLKRKIRANVTKQRRDDTKKVQKKEEEIEKRKRSISALKFERTKDMNRRRRIKAEEEEKAEDDDLISLDKIMEAMEDVSMEEGFEDDEAMLEMDVTDSGDEKEIEAEDDEELDDFEDVEDFEGVDDEVDSVEEPGDEEEYYDLDMVLSMLNKKQRIAARRKVKAEGEEDGKEVEKEKTDGAELDVEEVKEKVQEVKEQVENVQPTQPVDTENVEKKEEEVVEKEPDMKAQENPKTEDVPAEMEAMKFEPLASTEALASVRKEDIDMTLYNEESENPVWNVTVAGVPTARIQLKQQAHPEEIRSVFCSDDYAKDLMVHCEKTGFVQTMNKVKAEFWSNYTSNKKIAERFKKDAYASFDMERKKLLATFKQDFRNCMNIVSAGLAKNFYPDMGNPLKEHLFTNLRTVGLPESTAISVVEKSFAEGSAPYFDALFEKSEDYMGLTSDARKEIAAAISHGSTIEQKVSSDLENASPATLAERMAQASALASMSGSPLKVNNNLVMDTNEFKAQLKSAWRK